MDNLRYLTIIVAVSLVTSSYGSRVGENYNDVEAELKAGHAPYIAKSLDKDHRVLSTENGQLVAIFHGDIAIAILSHFKEPLTDAKLKDIRGEGSWNPVVPGKSWVRGNDGMTFAYDPENYTVLFANAEGVEFLKQHPG
jgi:hypothetical protein